MKPPVITCGTKELPNSPFLHLQQWFLLAIYFLCRLYQVCGKELSGESGQARFSISAFHKTCRSCLGKPQGNLELPSRLLGLKVHSVTLSALSPLLQVHPLPQKCKMMPGMFWNIHEFTSTFCVTSNCHLFFNF